MEDSGQIVYHHCCKMCFLGKQKLFLEAKQLRSPTELWIRTEFRAGEETSTIKCQFRSSVVRPVCPCVLVAPFGVFQICLMIKDFLVFCLLLASGDSSGATGQNLQVHFEILTCFQNRWSCLAGGLYLKFCVIILVFHYSLRTGYLQKIMMQLWDCGVKHSDPWSWSPAFQERLFQRVSPVRAWLVNNSLFVY